MRNDIRSAISDQDLKQLYALTVKPGQLCRCIVPPMNGHPEALWSDQNQKRPVIVTEVNEQDGTATIIPGTSTDNRWGCKIQAGKYGLKADTYFHTHEPRTVPLSKLEDDQPEFLTKKDFQRVTTWRPVAQAS